MMGEWIVTPGFRLEPETWAWPIREEPVLTTPTGAQGWSRDIRRVRSHGGSVSASVEILPGRGVASRDLGLVANILPLQGTPCLRTSHTDQNGAAGGERPPGGHLGKASGPESVAELAVHVRQCSPPLHLSVFIYFPSSAEARLTNETDDLLNVNMAPPVRLIHTRSPHACVSSWCVCENMGVLQS